MNKLIFADSAGPAWQKVRRHWAAMTSCGSGRTRGRSACARQGSDLECLVDRCRMQRQLPSAVQRAAAPPPLLCRRRRRRPLPPPAPPKTQAYSNSHYALAALLPASLVSPSDGAIAKVADVGLAAAITAHNHIAINYGQSACCAACLVDRGGRLLVAHAARHAPNLLPRCPSRTSACPTVISDYVPRGIQVPVRAGVVGLSLLTAVGLTKLALGGACACWRPGRCLL